MTHQIFFIMMVTLDDSLSQGAILMLRDVENILFHRIDILKPMDVFSKYLNI